MAFSAPTVGSVLNLSLKFVDTGDNETILSVKVPFDTDIASTIANAVSIAAAYQAATDALLQDANLSVPLFDDVAPAAAAGRHVEDQAIITAALVASPGQSSYGNLRIPTPKDDIMVGASGPAYNQVDVADALVTAVLGLYEASGVAVLSDNQNIDTPVSATGKRIHRASRRG